LRKKYQCGTIEAKSQYPTVGGLKTRKGEGRKAIALRAGVGAKLHQEKKKKHETKQNGGSWEKYTKKGKSRRR